MRGISFRAVVTGGVTDIGLSVLLGTLIQAFLAGGKPSTGGGLFTLQLLVGLACSVLGGYVAASIATENRALNGLLASSLSVALGVYTLAAHMVPLSVGLQLLLIAITPVCYLVGASLRLRKP
jgi:hypothetical protein